jgi:hypothetical protein
MPPARRARVAVIGSGVILMVGSAIAAFAMDWLLYTMWPAVQPQSRLAFVVPFAPLTAVFIVIAGSIWTRRLRPSAVETIGVLLCVELIAYGIVGLIAGGFFALIVFMFWAVSNIVFAPWWLLAVWIGRTTGRVARN